MKLFSVLVTLALSMTALGASKKTTTTTTYSSYSSTSSDLGSEVQLGAGGGGVLLSEKAGSSTVTNISGRGSYAHLFTNFWDGHFQVGGEGAFTSSSGGAKSSSRFDAAGFATWNLSTELRDSFYGKAGAGLFSVVNNSGDYESKFGFFAGVGVRVPILGVVNYTPEARLYKKGDLDPSFEILFLNASVFF